MLVVDEFGGKGNVLNFNVGEGVKLALPNIFWTRLQGKYGTVSFAEDRVLEIPVVGAHALFLTAIEDVLCERQWH